MELSKKSHMETTFLSVCYFKKKLLLFLPIMLQQKGISKELAGMESSKECHLNLLVLWSFMCFLYTVAISLVR